MCNVRPVTSTPVAARATAAFLPPTASEAHAQIQPRRSRVDQHRHASDLPHRWILHVSHTPAGLEVSVVSPVLPSFAVVCDPSDNVASAGEGGATMES